VIAKDASPDVSMASPAAAAPARDSVREFEPRRVKMSRRPLSAPGQTPAESLTPLLQTPRGQEGAADIEVIQREAFRQGHQEGERAGEERAAAQYRDAIAGLGRSVLQVATLKPRLRAEAERDLVELAFAIARRILRREVSVDPTAVVGLIRGCLDQYSRAEISRLQVHPQDLAAVTEFFDQNPAPQLEVVADPKVSPGGAVFQTTRGVLDARFETQLEEIEKGLTDR
jgi:flagellar assembly protein FliH